MSGTLEEIIAKQTLNQGKHLWVRGGVESMAAVIDLHTGKLEAAGVTAHTVGLLDDGDLVSLPGQTKSGHEARRAGSQNNDSSHAA